MEKYRLIAKDCMPFYLNGEECAGNAIGESDAKPKWEEICLRNLVKSIIPVRIYDDAALQDDDSKLAYSPIENKPYHWHSDAGDVEKRVWLAGRYVGTAQIEGRTIEIRPRFGNLWLVHILDDIFHFQITANEQLPAKGEYNELIRRILWRLWIRKFSAADRYGLPRQTIKQTHRGIQFRGHLNTRKSIFPFFTKRQAVSEYREKDLDDTICRIIYKAYDILVNKRINRNLVPNQIQDSLNSLYNHYQGVPISISSYDYRDISYKSIYVSWKPLVDFSWQVLQQDCFYKQKESCGESFSIFFDMAEIWEAFLRKKLGEGFAEDGWRVLSIEECRRGIYTNQFYHREIIPDIILRKGNDYMVFDAKYKLMSGNRNDVDRNDVFQIHTYIQFVQHHMGNVVIGGLLYPISTEEEENKESSILGTNEFYSDNIFGLDGKYKTAFIVDGVVCSEFKEDNSDNADKLHKRKEDYINVFDENVNAMIGRINEILKKKIANQRD
ncbi:MAG: hypothetical protein IJV11_03455 [Muribaculaceae bacterium]|nr:hypothetical protein [Muribaculaceae bacterium]